MTRDLTDQEAHALRSFANKYGCLWKAKLSLFWQMGRIDGPLYGLRNSHGPSWLDQLEQLPSAPFATGLSEFVGKYHFVGAVQTQGRRSWKISLRYDGYKKSLVLYHPGNNGVKYPQIVDFLQVALESKDQGVQKSLKKFLGNKYQEALLALRGPNERF